MSTGGSQQSSQRDGEDGGSASTGGSRQPGGGDTQSNSGGTSEEEETGGADSQASATGGSGSSASVAERALGVCQNQQAIGYLFNCTAAYEESYISDCVDAWVEAAEQCPAEADSLLDCSDMREVLDHQCDADRKVILASGVCEAETEAFDACLGS